MVHGLSTLAKINDLAAVNKLAKGNYQRLPAQFGIINSVASDCEGYRLFKYPAIAGRMKLSSQEHTGEFVFVECSQKSIDLIGKGEFKNAFDAWADEHCKVLCSVA